MDFSDINSQVGENGLINYRLSLSLPPTSTDSREAAAGPPRGAGGGARQSAARIAEEGGQPDKGTESFHGARWRVLSE